LDFESAYSKTINQQTATGKQDIFDYWHPCYKINAETVPGQDYIIGRDLEMFG
jgi:hypothetical protein